MKARVIELDMTWEALATRAGVVVETLRSIRKGRNRPNGRTARRIEDALAWAYGSIDAILAGGEPTLAVAERDDLDAMDPAELLAEARRLIELAERVQQRRDARSRRSQNWQSAKST